MRVVPLAAPLLLGACTLLVPTDDLSGGSVDGGVPLESGSPEAGQDDAAVDAPQSVPDAAQDGGQVSTYRDLVLKDAPRAYWRMGIASGTTIPDETGGGNSLALLGTGFVLAQPGAIAGDNDTAISFDGAGSYATAKDARVFDYPDHHPFTLEAWARHDGRTGSMYQHLIGDLEDQGGSPPRNGYYLYANRLDAGVNFSLEWDTPGAPQAIASSDRVGDGTWAHVCAVFDGQVLRVFVNAAPSVPVAVGTASITPRKSLLIVGAEEPGGHTFSGLIDEMAVYDTALTVQQVARHFAAGGR
jgi:hypothetical protein